MKILAIGHTTVDLFFKLPEAHLHRVDLASRELCLPFPEKLYLTDFQTNLGGNAPNTGAGLLKLGAKVSLMGYIGNDSLGRMIREHLNKQGFNLHYLTEDGKSDISGILSFSGDRVILAYHSPHSWTWVDPDETFDWIYLSSLGSKDYQAYHLGLSHYLNKQLQINVAYNPGKTEIKKQASELGILAQVDVLILNKQESGLLLGQPVGEETNVSLIRQLADSLRNYGPATIIITDGANGSYGYDGTNFYHMPAFEVEIVDHTGAGDAFSSGVVAALANTEPLATALRWGTAQASSVIQHVGAAKGLLTLSKLHEILNRSSDIMPEKL